MSDEQREHGAMLLAERKRIRLGVNDIFGDFADSNIVVPIEMMTAIYRVINGGSAFEKPSR